MKNKLTFLLLMIPFITQAQTLERITTGLYKFSFDAFRTENTEVTYIISKTENFAKSEISAQQDSIFYIRCNVGVKFSVDRVEYRKENRGYSRTAKLSTKVYYIPYDENHYFIDQQQVFWPLKPNK